MAAKMPTFPPTVSRRRRIRAATSGDWRNHLSPAHLTIFRERYADRIRALGYEVR